MTYKEDFNRKYGFEPDKSHSLKEIADLTGFPLTGLQTIFRKGKGAFFTNPSSVRPLVKRKGGANRWAYARVYSAVMGGKAAQVDHTELSGSGYPIVRIGKYKNHQSRTKIGQRARFAVKPQRPGWIVQNVTLWWNLDGEKESITYAEAWRVISGRKINQSGDDDFMVPRSWIANHSGSLNVIAQAWWQAKLGNGFAEGDGEELWGRLYGADDHQTPTGPVLERFWIARWQKGETPMFDSQTRNLE